MPLATGAARTGWSTACPAAACCLVLCRLILVRTLSLCSTFIWSGTCWCKWTKSRSGRQLPLLLVAEAIRGAGGPRAAGFQRPQ